MTGGPEGGRNEEVSATAGNREKGSVKVEETNSRP